MLRPFNAIVTGEALNSVLQNLVSGNYTVNHKKRDMLFLTITLANLNRFLQFFYIILIVKKLYMRL